jgi:hypothetical protein
MAGGGVRGGQVYGATDKAAAYVKDDPVGPADLAATVLFHLGIDLSLEYHAPLLNERHPICTGRPLRLS